MQHSWTLIRSLPKSPGSETVRWATPWGKKQIFFSHQRDAINTSNYVLKYVIGFLLPCLLFFFKKHLLRGVSHNNWPSLLLLFWSVQTLVLFYCFSDVPAKKMGPNVATFCLLLCQRTRLIGESAEMCKTLGNMAAFARQLMLPHSMGFFLVH